MLLHAGAPVARAAPSASHTKLTTPRTLCLFALCVQHGVSRTKSRTALPLYWLLFEPRILPQAGLPNVNTTERCLTAWLYSIWLEMNLGVDSNFLTGSGDYGRWVPGARKFKCKAFGKASDNDYSTTIKSSLRSSCRLSFAFTKLFQLL